MSGSKRWKVPRKTASKSSFNHSHSDSSSLDNNSRPPPSPPTRLPNEDPTAATAIVDFGSGSTLVTHAGPPTVGSNSSIDSVSTGLTPSPSTTPPKKTWEKNYKSFLKRSSKNPKPPAPSSSGARLQHATSIKPVSRHNQNEKATRCFSQNENASAILSESHSHQQIFSAQISGDLGLSLADGFEDLGSTMVTNNRSSNVIKQSSMGAPPSPSKHKESNLRGGTFFKRLRNKTKSVDNLDHSMRRGIDRKSPTNTPPGSASSTPIHKHSPALSLGGVTTMQDGMEKAAMLSELLFPPTLSSSMSFGSHDKLKSGRLIPPPSILSQGNLKEDDNLDQARHHGHTVSLAPSTTSLQQSPGSPKPSLFSRVQSMGSNHIIPEGEPVIDHNKEEELIREKRKAFTDFHNMGVDSSSAYLGDESSLHRHSVFLSSMAYPAGSAGGKVRAHHPMGQGAHSFDQKRDSISPSTSMNSVLQQKPQHQEAEPGFSPERALRSLKDPEHWTKGERHAIVPAVLCMCPIQVVNNIMSKEDGSVRKPSLTSQSSQSGFGIGSIISEDEGVDSNGWFFADHHQPTTLGGVLPRQGSNSNKHMLPSMFGQIVLGKATVAPLGMRSFLTEVYGWCTGVFILRQNYLFEYREGDSLNGLPWGYAHLPYAEAYPHKHFTNALHLDFFERPCSKSGKRSLLLRVENKGERDRWVSMLHSAARMTMHDLYEVDDSDEAPAFGHGRYAVVRPAKRRDRRRSMSFSDGRYSNHYTASTSQDSFRNTPSVESLGGKTSNPDLENTAVEYDCALKIIDKTEFWSRVKKGRERADTLVREAAVQTTLAVQGGDAPGFLRLHNIFETGEKLVLELELLKGTDLFHHISSHGVLGEIEAAHIMKDLLTCLNVLDQVGIAHRDIKPANLLMCRDEDSNGAKIKLADYGMASFVGVDNLVRGRCGTPGFVAPEILLTRVNGGYGNKVDMFSAGVTMYVMLAGYEPFYGESDAELINANREAKVDFPHADWHTVSVEGRDLIERMLVVDPSKRIGPSEALRHPWITRRATALHKD